LKARRSLLDAWQENRKRPDAYLDTLLSVSRAGFLEEYVAYYFGKDGWQVPSEVEMDMDAFRDWRRSRLNRHKPETRLVGFWGYRHAVSHTAAAPVP
jgi:hypothetical protein